MTGISTLSRQFVRRPTTDDGALRSVLGEESGRDTAGREDNDSSGILLNGGGDSGEGKSLGGLGRSGSKLSELVKEGLVGNGVLGGVSSLGHHLD